MLDPAVTVMEHGVPVLKQIFVADRDDRLFTLPAGHYGLAFIGPTADGLHGAYYNLGKVNNRWVIEFDVKEGEVLYLGHWHFDPRRRDAKTVRLDIRIDDKFEEIADDLRFQLNRQEAGRGDKLTSRLVSPSRSSVTLVSIPIKDP